MAFSCYGMVLKFILPFSVGILFVSVALTKKVELNKRGPVKPTKDEPKPDVTIKVVTWNVADNKEMTNEISLDAIGDVLRLAVAGNMMPSIYAIGLQEDVWNCNKQNWPNIGARFLEKIDPGGQGYQVVGIQGTREDKDCEGLWGTKMHGSTILLVIAKKGLVESFKVFRHNEGCSKLPGVATALATNKEKGVAAMQVLLSNKNRVCFGTAHLDALEPHFRRKCLKKFLATADKEVSWSKSCDYQFIFGDFNTRTGPIVADQTGANGIDSEEQARLLNKDELDPVVPANAYGADKEWPGSLLGYVNDVQKKKDKESKSFQEAAFNFVPTFSILPKEECAQGGNPCYALKRPKSWTDRIIFTGDLKACKRYDAIYEKLSKLYGDHFPVYADFAFQMTNKN